MSTNVGSIKYTVEAETGDLLTAEKVVDKTTDSMAKDFNKVDNAVKKTSNEFKGAATKIQASNAKMSKSAKGVNTAVAGMGRGAGQAGIQLQQFIGQVQGGQSAMLALSQQSADLGIVLGAPLLGAVVGISASIAGMLLPNLFKATEKTEDFTQALRDLASQQQLTSSQAAILMEAEGRKINENITKREELLDKIKEQEKTALGQRQEIVSVSKSNLPEAIDIRERFTRGLNESKAELSKLNVALVLVDKEIENGTKNMITYNKNIGDGKQTTSAMNEKVDSLTETLNQQMLALSGNDKAAFKYATSLQLGLKSVELLPEGVDAHIDALFRQKEALEETALAKRKADSEARKADAERRSEDAKNASIKAQGVSLSQSVINKGMSPEEKMKAEMLALTNLRDTDLENQKLHQEAITALELQHAEKRKQIADATKEDQLINWQSIEDQAIGTFAAIATGAMDGKDAIRSLAQSILTQMVGALIKMGVQAVIGQTTTAAATAASMSAIAVSAAPAAALVSLATSGANSPLAVAGMTTASGVATGLALPGRQFGGGVSGGSAYEMGENGTEILQQGNKNIVIPGRSGNVISNSELGGGGTTININNMASGVDVQARPSADGKTIEIAVRQAVAEMTNQVASGNGQFVRALRSNTNVTSKASR